jgi:hypothetical protein
MFALKGAFINLGTGLLGSSSTGLPGGLPNIVIFQFNPEKVSRTPTLAQPPQDPVGAGQVDATQQASEPTESYSFVLKLDATDQLAQSNPIAAASGILPALSALELLMLPQPAVKTNLAQLAKSSSTICVNPPTKLPAVLFVWGPSRIWPVTINKLLVDETEYDPQLNPVRAEVTVGLQVLTPSQMESSATLAQGAYQYSIRVKQAMAALNLANAAQLGLNGNFPLSL